MSNRPLGADRFYDSGSGKHQFRIVANDEVPRGAFHATGVVASCDVQFVGYLREP